MRKNIDEPVALLLIEDNAADVLLLQTAMEHSRIDHTLAVRQDGAAALEHLIGSNGDAIVANWPDLVLLDINVPKVDGFEVLRRLKAHPVLRIVPIIMWSSSGDPATVRRAYEGGAAAFVCKGGQFDEVLDMILSLETFWFRFASLPRL